jgi:hypothetical protein
MEWDNGRCKPVKKGTFERVRVESNGEVLRGDVERRGRRWNCVLEMGVWHPGFELYVDRSEIRCGIGGIIQISDVVNAKYLWDRKGIRRNICENLLRSYLKIEVRRYYWTDRRGLVDGAVRPMANVRDMGSENESCLGEASSR